MLHDFLHDGRVTSKELHLFLEPDNIFLECTNVTASLIVRRHLITVQSEEKSISARVIKYEKKKKKKGEYAVGGESTIGVKARERRLTDRLL